MMMVMMGHDGGKDAMMVMMVAIMVMMAWSINFWLYYLFSSKDFPASQDRPSSDIICWWIVWPA